MSNLSYWEKRFLQTKASQLKSTEEYERALQYQSKALQHELDIEMNKYYRRYYQTNNISEEETRKILNNIGNSNWKMTLDQFKKKAIEGGHQEELDSEYFKSRIARLQNLESQLKQRTGNFAKNQQSSMKDALSKQYGESYMRTIFNSQSAHFSFSGNFAHLNDNQLRTIVSKPWKGSDFSKRIWNTYQKELPDKLMDSILRGSLMGYHPSKISRMMHAEFQDVNKKEIHRLITTEFGHINEEATAKGYEESGIEQYEYMATLEAHTCMVCAHLDGQIFKLSDRKDGINYPTIHPYCRCTTVPYIEGLPEVGERWMRDPETGEGKLTDNMSFNKWNKLYGEPDKPNKTPKIIGIDPHDKSKWPSGIRVSETLDGDKVQFESEQGMALGGEWLSKLMKYSDYESLVGSIESHMGNGRFGSPKQYKDIADWVKEVKSFKDNPADKPNNEPPKPKKIKIPMSDREKYIHDQGEVLFNELFTSERKKTFIKTHNYQIYRNQEVADYNAGRSHKSRDEVIAIDKQNLKLKRSTLKKFENDLTDAIKEYREVGFVGKDGQTFRSGSSKVSQSMVNRTLNNFPRDWSYKSATRPMITGTAKRGFYNESRGELKISGIDAIDKQITTYHELGHRIEDLNPEIHNLLLEFYDRRTANDDLMKLSDVTGIKDYADNEVTRVDKFNSPYMGKDYDREGTELLSMGIEGLISGKYELEKDKDYATLILGILRYM